ncbi:MAG: tRNA (N(6)-L-threonylcarbamoyladenosine(37)-C(2))-methylthiotransferase MtaB [bacterium]|nr:tRNA (N(6)-L-threonylcarbamoyladenosine(37)-C(2))-methylthiotransferase MtaB [bacterium]
MKREEKQAKSIFFATLGCRLNQAETQKLRTDALNLGLTIVPDEDKADIFVLNSCSVTDKAQRDTEKILKRLNKEYPKKQIIVTGCGARDEHKKYAVVVKNEEKGNLFCPLERNEMEPRDPLKNAENTIRERDFSTRPVRKSVEMTDNRKTRLMYKVQDGCNNFCSYCIVPYVRGRERSIEVGRIVNELKMAEKCGFKEIVLCGVNIGRYEHKDLKLADVIEEILKNTRFPRIRLSSINPDDFTDDLVALWAQNDRLCPHFHISLQSGSDTVLKRMGRKYSLKQYADLAIKLRENIPEVQITTDVIVGFPGETEAEFAETVEFVKKMQFLKVHVFRYSPREGTRAAKMPDQLSGKTKKERAMQLKELDSKIRQEILKSYIGKEAEVLFEQEKSGVYAGFTPNYIKVSKNSKKDLSNQILKFKVTGTGNDGLTV